jgi:uracil-DNA glycosylase
MVAFCPGYGSEPFRGLVSDYPGEDVYAPSDFRTEWGPIFHRGRLDGTARVLLIGQDPGQHENVLRRILVGEAGRRAQGFLGKLGITRSYVLINALLYSVYGSNGEKYLSVPSVSDYRNRWLEALLAPGSVEVVVTFGKMAETAWKAYATAKGAPSGIVVSHLTHPTFPESAGGSAAQKAANTKTMLEKWNSGLALLHPAVVHKDQPSTPLVPYGDAFAPEDKVDIPADDIPPGIPRWMIDDDGWASRGYPAKLPTASTPEARLRLKRSIIVIRVPKGQLP